MLKKMHVSTRCGLLVITSLMASCSWLRPAPPAPAEPPAATPAIAAQARPAPDPWLAQAGKEGRQLLRIDPAASLIAITVRRGGALQRLGHDHVVATRTLRGWAVAPAGAKPGRTEFSFRADEMSVDEADLRAIAGLPPPPTFDYIAGTRKNMLNKVLEADQYPEVRVAAQTTTPGGPLETAITLHGVTRHYVVPATLQSTGGRVRATGSVQLKQTDFGITPYSLLGGALAVQDEIELRFDITAAPQSAASPGR